MESHQLINQDSGDVEYYTPTNILEAARRTMGGIDLDPASSIVANQRVRATMFFTAADNSLERPWKGKIWLNHPFSRVNNPLFIRKLISEHEKGNVIVACCITYAATSEKWFRPLLAFPQCFLYGRTGYVRPDGMLKKGNTKGSVVTLVGGDVAKFRENFSSLGAVKV